MMATFAVNLLIALPIAMGRSEPLGFSRAHSFAPKKYGVANLGILPFRELHEPPMY